MLNVIYKLIDYFRDVFIDIKQILFFIKICLFFYLYVLTPFFLQYLFIGHLLQKGETGTHIV